MAHIKLPSAQRVVKRFGLDKKGATQMFLDNELLKASDPFTPKDTGNLKNSPYSSGGALHWDFPYATVLYFGIIMVDPKTGIAGFPTSDGFKSRKGVKKIKATDSGNRRSDLPTTFNYNGAPLRGSKWLERAFKDNKKQIINSVEQYIKRGV